LAELFTDDGTAHVCQSLTRSRLSNFTLRYVEIADLLLALSYSMYII